jgi:hypothetical protein
MKTPYQRFWLLLKPDSKEIYQVYTYAFFKGVIALSLPIIILFNADVVVVWGNFIGPLQIFNRCNK